MKFNNGDKVFHFRMGVTQIIRNETSSIYPIRTEDGLSYTEGGKFYVTDLYPSIYTLEDARVMGFEVPIQKTPEKVWRVKYKDNTESFTSSKQVLDNILKELYTVADVKEFVEVMKP